MVPVIPLLSPSKEAFCSDTGRSLLPVPSPSQLTAALATVPTEHEWFANLSNNGTRRVYELNRTYRHINKINHLALQITAKPGKKYANLPPVATRNRTLKTRLHPRGMSHDRSSHPSLSSWLFRLSG